MLVVVMGVAGAGKTTIGAMLASALDCPFLDGDSLHPEESIEAMRRGVPLTEADRAPWLLAVHEQLRRASDRGESLVVACSALRRSYRDTIAGAHPVEWVYLRGSEALIHARLTERTGHFMSADMLASQTGTLEEPDDAIVADVTPPPHAVAEYVLAELRARPDLRVLEDVDRLGECAAAAAVDLIGRAVRERGNCTIALSGGRTPRPMYRALAGRFRDEVPWDRVHLFWCDERYVAPDDPRSNFGMVRAALLDHVPCPPGNVHPMPTAPDDPDTAARDYERTLHRHFGGALPRFDLVVLGIGADGHVASLFPGAPELPERSRWVVPATAPAGGPPRLTLTLPVLCAAARIFVLASGAEKAPEIARVREGSADPAVYPAVAVQAEADSVTWWLDRAASGAPSGSR